MDNNSIPIVFGLDEKYVLSAFVVMHSILSNSDEKYVFYILTTDQIMDQVNEYTALLCTEYVNFSVSVRMLDRNLFTNAKIFNKHLSIAAYFRLLISDELREWDKCIYLDCDTLVNGDISELFRIDIEDNYLAGVKDCHVIQNTPKQQKHLELLGIPAKDRYVNSGVLLMNLKKLRNDRMITRFLVQMNQLYWYEDQDILNRCCYPYIKTLPLKFNLFHFYYGKSISLLREMDYKDEDFNFEEPLIIHMGAEWKPWKSKKVKCADKWWDLAAIYKGTTYYNLFDKYTMEKDDLESMFEMLDHNRTRKIVICGFSKTGRNLCSMLLTRGYNNIAAFADNDESKWGNKYQNIEVQGFRKILDIYNDTFFLISNQVVHEEIREQLIGYGVDEYYIIRYKNCHTDKLYLLSLDEKNYDSEKKMISKYEFPEISNDERKEEYLHQILANPSLYQEEYAYLDQKYHFEYWCKM